jgi:simple sugar transport system permease protein
MEATKLFRRFMHKTEFYIFLVLVIGCIAIQIISGGQLFEINTIVDIARSIIIFGMFALINVMVVISGGFDLSFPTLASLSYSATATIVLNMGWCKENAWAAFFIAAFIGLLCGMLNGYLIAWFKLDTMIVTLGTQTLFLGLGMGLFQFREITSILPEGLNILGDASLFEVYSSTGLRSIMPTVFLMFIFLALIVWFILNHTMFGRSIFAIGGNEASAERAGINVIRTKFLLYAFVGLVAGIIGITRVCMVHQSIPKALNGWDLRVIPAVILGGASIYGGEGSVFGTLVAVTLMTVISNSLLLIGIGSYWQNFFNGIVILVGITVSAVQAKRRSI